MRTDVQCPRCGHNFEMQPSYYGQNIHCPLCGSALAIPGPVQPSATPSGDTPPAYATGCGASAPPVLNYAPADARYAGFWIRFAADLVDTLIILVPAVVVSAIIPILGSLLVWFFYKSLCIANWNGYTVGKKLCSIRVVDESLGPCSTGQAFGRTAAEMLSSLILWIGYLMIAFDARKQGLHDKISGTLHIYG